VGKLFSRAWNKGTTAGNVVNGFECTDLFPFKRSTISDDKFLPSRYFHQVSSDFLPPNSSNQTSFSTPGSPMPTAQLLQFSSRPSLKTAAELPKITQEGTGITPEKKAF
jgi:hypothetical protein